MFIIQIKHLPCISIITIISNTTTIVVRSNVNPIIYF
nr:MAG TPA: hypothetical protein [Caudoviricetes sp.]